MSIDVLPSVLPDDVQLKIFDSCMDAYPLTKKTPAGVADTGARVSAMTKHCFWIITSPEFGTYLYG